MARTPTLSPASMDRARAYLAEGKTIAQTAELLEVSSRTINRMLAREDEPETDQIMLPRTGQAPLQLTGIEIAQADGSRHGCKPGKANSDWYVITIYALSTTPAAPDVTHAVTIDYHKNLHGQESHHFTAHLTDSPGRVLARFDPIIVIVGYPDSPNFDAQQRQLEDNCARQYFALVSEVLKQFPEDIATAITETRDGELLDIFAHLCHLERAQWSFTRAEAALICEACHDTFLHGDAFLLLPGELASALTDDSFTAKWCVSEDELRAKIGKLKGAGLAALAVSIRTFWEHTDKPTNVALSLAGFNFS